MSFEPIGILTVVIGLICLLLGTSAVVIAFVVFCSLGSAAALLFSGANVQPAHLFLVFLVISTVFRRRIATEMLGALRLPAPGFWLLCLVLYGLASSYVLPRLFAGQTYIVPLGSSEHLITNDGVVPLGPVSSNLTQTIYLLGDLVCFIVIVAIGSTASGVDTLAKALIAYAVVNICFGFLDLITAATGTQDALQFIRNAQYTFHDEESVGSLRRIIGAWPEASAFAGTTLGPCAFTGMLFVSGHRPLLTGSLSLVSLLFVIFSTSSTGLVGSIVVVALLYTMALFRCSTRWIDRSSAAIVIAGPLVGIALVLLALSIGGIAETIYDYVDTLIFSKSSTSSGIQRASWNVYAWRNFVESNGFGVGLGTNRTSSFALAILSNVGLPGAVFYFLFIASVYAVGRGAPRTYSSDFRSAAWVASLCLVIGGVIAGPTVDQGLLFYVFAGCACAFPERTSLRSHQALELQLNQTQQPPAAAVKGATVHFASAIPTSQLSS